MIDAYAARLFVAAAASVALLGLCTWSCRAVPFDPLAQAQREADSGDDVDDLDDDGRPDREVGIPPVCYARTDGGANVCWTCHVPATRLNPLGDAELQHTRAFSELARHNPWTNLLTDRTHALPEVNEQELLAWVRTDNLTPLRAALATADGYPGFVPDLELAQGFDDEGFARDGSGWRAVRYWPFPGVGWPGAGGVGDVFIRLPRALRSDPSGALSRDVERENLARLERAIASDPGRTDDALALEARYAGGGAAVPLYRGVFPRGTELLHTVRYLDPDAPDLFAARLRELRYMRKVDDGDAWSRVRAAERAVDEKAAGHVPRQLGNARVGLVSSSGWQLQGFIEDEGGRLRLSSAGELRACLGCHGSLGVTVDGVFSFARKVAGAGGWQHQDLRGLKDVPQRGHTDGELLTWIRRAGRAVDAVDADLGRRLAPGGVVDEALVRRAAPGGDLDLAALLVPSRARALLLDNAVRESVRAQSFRAGRDPPLVPAGALLEVVAGDSTGLAEAGRVYLDGVLHLAGGDSLPRRSLIRATRATSGNEPMAARGPRRRVARVDYPP